MKSDSLRIVANGEERTVPALSSITDFLGICGWKATQVVVEYNGEVLSRTDLAKVHLAEGDRLEIIVPVAGG